MSTVLRRSEREWLKNDIKGNYLAAGEFGYDITNKELRIGDGKTEFYRLKTFIERYSINRMSIIMGLLSVMINNVLSALIISMIYRNTDIDHERAIIVALFISAILLGVLLVLIDRMMNRSRKRNKIKEKLIRELKEFNEKD